VKRLMSILSVAWMLLAALAPSFAATPGGPSANATFITGVDLVGPTSASLARQNAQIAQLKAAGVRLVRTGFGVGDENIDFAKRLYDQGIKILLIVGPSYPLDAPVRPVVAGFSDMRPGQKLISADPGLSKDYFQTLLGKLDGRGVVLAGLELDNEINWADGNRTFPLPGEGKVFGLDDLTRDPEAKTIAESYLQYLKVMAAMKDVRDHATLNRRTPILSAGLSPVGPEGPKTGGGAWAKEDAVSVKATLGFLRAHGLDSLVDFYGIHYYPQGGTAAARKTRLQALAVSECRPPNSKIGKPCWMTEWGVADRNQSCPVNERIRIPLVAETIGQFREVAADGRLPVVIYYAWDGRPGATGLEPFSIYRCGAVTEAGKLALNPK
jgi:hypothetical protein